MISLKPLLFALLLLSQSFGVDVIEPITRTGWTSSGPNDILWQNTTGDPAYFRLQLAQNNQTTFTASDAITADGIIVNFVPASYLFETITPSCKSGQADTGVRLPTGTGFTLRFLATNEDGTEEGQLLGTSEVFSIIDSTATYCVATTTSTSSAPSTPSTGSGSVSSGDLLTSSPSHVGAIIGGTIGGVLALLLLIGAACIRKHVSVLLRSP
ncbi:hypothetical protein FIBSPDRAFT_962787 [Athelia psychrophila]|uniref:Mid2 domain-containing protein n=1 Tax=Athelia psychrophila TaxID=1759441 RepID=A0A165ZPV1_9AGAM|nr:hypothetical protein FIBSPDRAFT_962787 [Fibularhizoctonia sp. CBS 109695]